MWQAWHLVTSTCILHGRRGTWRHRPSLCGKCGSREMEGINHMAGPVQLRQRNPAARNKEAKGDQQRLTWKHWSMTRSTLTCWIQSLRSSLDNQHCTKHLQLPMSRISCQQDTQMGPTNNGAVDERTGEPLPEDKVKKVREREPLKMESHNAKTDITWKAKDMGLKIVKSRWVEGWKPLPNDPHGVRSRCVAMEINNGPRDDVSSGTPPLVGHRTIVSLAAPKRKGQKFGRRLLGRYDVSVAFFHAKPSGKLAVIPPKDLQSAYLWYLNKTMNGRREASKCWSQEIIGTLKPVSLRTIETVRVSLRTIETVPGMFYHPEWDVTMSFHGDNFLAEGPAEGLDRLDEAMTYGGETTSGEHLHRLITWSEGRFTWQADPKYAKLLVKEMCLRLQRSRHTCVKRNRKEFQGFGQSPDRRGSYDLPQARRDGAVSVVGQTFNPVRNGRYCVWNGQANGTAQPQTETVGQVI